MPKIGLQLWTVKDYSERDFFGTLRKVSEIGYDGVEFAGYYGAGAEELAAHMNNIGLTSAATHLPIHRLERALDEELAFAEAIRCSTLICPWLPDDYRDSEAAAYRTVETLNQIGRQCKEAGVQLLYHIHGYEFKCIDKKSVMDIFLEASDPQVVGFEFDTYWVEAAGLDGVEYYRTIGRRCPYIHIKDYNNKHERHDVEVGEGVLDTHGLLEEAVKLGAAWVVVEQEKFNRPSLDSARISYNNLRELLSR